jgi:hypothetical protein
VTHGGRHGDKSRHTLDERVGGAIVAASAFVSLVVLLTQNRPTILGRHGRGSSDPIVLGLIAKTPARKRKQKRFVAGVLWLTVLSVAPKGSGRGQLWPGDAPGASSRILRHLSSATGAALPARGLPWSEDDPDVPLGAFATYSFVALAV